MQVLQNLVFIINKDNIKYTMEICDISKYTIKKQLKLLTICTKIK